MNEFSFGPFTFTPGHALRVAGASCRRWQMLYGSQFIAERAVTEPAQQATIIEAFGEDRNAFVAAHRRQHAPDRVSLIDRDHDTEVAHFFSDVSCGMTPGVIDDRSRYWIRSADRLLSREVSLTQFGELVRRYTAPAEAWIAGLLPDDILTADLAEWRAPTAWEIRHIVGEGSFTGITGAMAAQLVGVTPQNFRKYTARAAASTRQNMSFAMWHLLLHRLSVQTLSQGEPV